MTVLRREMTRQGLKFARATTAGQPAYVSLHSSRVEYFVWLDKLWDPLAK